MMKAKIYSGTTNEKLGTINCNSLDEAELFLAVNFPEHYFGANIIREDGDGALIIACKEAFSDIADKSPVDIAVESINRRLKIASNLFRSVEDEESVLRVPYKDVVSVNGRFCEG